MNNTPTKRPDGKYEEKLSENWVAEYSEQPMNGLWQAEVFKHGLPEWLATDFDSLEKAQMATRNYYDQI